MKRYLSLVTSLVVCTSFVVAAQDKRAADRPTPVEVIAKPEAHTGKVVSWAVRFRNIRVDIAPDGKVTGERAIYEWRDAAGKWSGVTIIAPSFRETTWTLPASESTESMVRAEPRLLTGRIVGVDQGSVMLFQTAIDLLPADDPFGTGAVKPGAGVSWPQVVYEEKPKYTPDAMRAKIEGSVELEIIVEADGRVGPVRVVKSLDPATGLDDAAVEAAKKWRFRPGMKDGKAVPTKVGLILEFRLKKD